MNKKEAKKLFFKLGHAGFAATGPTKPKVFAPLFSKKRAFLASENGNGRGITAPVGMLLPGDAAGEGAEN